MTAIVVRLLTGRFIWEYDPTLEAAYRYHTFIDDDPATIDVLDTAGQVSNFLVVNKNIFFFVLSIILFYVKTIQLLLLYFDNLKYKMKFTIYHLNKLNQFINFLNFILK